MSVIKTATISVGQNVGSLTAPTFDITVDGTGQFTDRGIVTALGGTQTDGRLHTISDPFVLNYKAPQTPRVVGLIDSTGVLRPQPKNAYQFSIIKGVKPLAGQAPQIGKLDISFAIPAGGETADPVAVDQLVAAGVAALLTWRADFLTSLKTGGK